MNLTKLVKSSFMQARRQPQFWGRQFGVGKEQIWGQLLMLQ